MFNWRTFLERNNIPYVERGRNVSKGNLAIHCPLCGTNDPSQHMNVNVKGKGWACWRDADHRGKNPTKLVQALLQCTWAEASEITGGPATPETDTDFMSQVRQAMGTASARPKLMIPKEWTPLTKWGGINGSLVFHYLESRGYMSVEAMNIAKRYELYYSRENAWAKRVIFPIRAADGTLLNYTARAIGKSNLRYKTLSGDACGASIGSCLFDLPALTKIRRGKLLVVCEGPFDAVRLTWFGKPYGIYATCVFTQNVSDDQGDALMKLRAGFDRATILFDRGAELQAIRAQHALGFERHSLPEGVKDPGAMTAIQGLMICNALLKAAA